MVTTVAVKRALAALATRTDTATRPYVAVIDEADAARGDVRRASGFVEAVGLERLSEAVADAERDGRDPLVERGRDALSSYRRYRLVASGGRTAFSSESGMPRETNRSVDREPSTDSDHSNGTNRDPPAPGTSKPATSQALTE